MSTEILQVNIRQFLSASHTLNHVKLLSRGRTLFLSSRKTSILSDDKGYQTRTFQNKVKKI
jgi:hypothetical protein